MVIEKIKTSTPAFFNTEEDFNELLKTLRKKLKECSDFEKSERGCISEKVNVYKCECGGDKLKLPHSDWCPKG